MGAINKVNWRNLASSKEFAIPFSMMLVVFVLNIRTEQEVLHYNPNALLQRLD